MPSAASEAAAQRVDDAVRAKDEAALRDAVSKDDTRELGSLAVCLLYTSPSPRD